MQINMNINADIAHSALVYDISYTVLTHANMHTEVL